MCLPREKLWRILNTILNTFFTVAFFPRTCRHGKVEILLNSIQVLNHLKNTQSNELCRDHRSGLTKFNK